MGSDGRKVCRPLKIFRHTALVFGTGPAMSSRVKLNNVRRARHRRKRGDRLFAPFRYHSFMLQTDAKSEQFAHVGRRGCSLRKALLEDALVALIAVAVMFQSRHE